jgi:hypothetical protein
MSKISRPATKEGGFSEYNAKVAAGFTAIIDQEVDDDFDTIYRDYNGFIDDNNIAPKSLNGARDLKDNSVTGQQIDESTLTINATTIVNFSIDITKLAPGAVINDVQYLSRTDDVPLHPGQSAMLLAVPINVRSTASLLFMFGIAAGSLHLTEDPIGEAELLVSIGFPFFPLATQRMSKLATPQAGAGPNPFSVTGVPFSVPVFWAGKNVVGNQTVQINAQLNHPANYGSTANSAQLFVVSFA